MHGILDYCRKKVGFLNILNVKQIQGKHRDSTQLAYRMEHSFALSFSLSFSHHLFDCTKPNQTNETAKKEIKKIDKKKKVRMTKIETHLKINNYICLFFSCSELFGFFVFVLLPFAPRLLIRIATGAFCPFNTHSMCQTLLFYATHSKLCLHPRRSVHYDEIYVAPNIHFVINNLSILLRRTMAPFWDRKKSYGKLSFRKCFV